LYGSLVLYFEFFQETIKVEIFDEVDLVEDEDEGEDDLDEEVLVEEEVLGNGKQLYF